MARSKRLLAQRWTAAEARAVLKELEGSRLSVPRFARQHGLGVERLYRWRRRLGQGRRCPQKPRFAELMVRPTASAGTIELELQGIFVRIAGESRVDDAVAILSRMPPR